MASAQLIVLKTLYDFCETQGFKHEHMIIAKELLEGRPKQDMPYSIRDIKLEVYKYLNLKEWQAEKRCRRRELVTARQIAMSLCHELRIYPSVHLSAWSFDLIGKQIGGYDHSTVTYAIRTINAHCRTEFNFRTQYNKIKRIIIEKYGIKKSTEAG